jgi:hypothetical protein
MCLKTITENAAYSHNKYLKATLRGGAESKYSGFAVLYRNPSLSALYRRAH